MQARFRIWNSQLTPYEQELLENAYKKRVPIDIRNKCRNLLMHCIRVRLSKEYPVMRYALMWAFKGYIDVYIPTEKMRQHSRVG